MSDPALEGRAKVREAARRIRPLPGDGPNRWTVYMPGTVGWSISAPTKNELEQMISQWFAIERGDHDHPAVGER